MTSHFRILFALFLGFSILSCSDDDSDTPNASTEGTWNLVTLSIESAFDLNNDGMSSTNLVSEVDCYENDFIEFFEDGTVDILNELTFIFPVVNPNDPSDFNYDHQCQSGLNIEADWTREGNTVFVTHPFLDLEGTISGNTMTVVIEEAFEIQLYDGMDFTDVEETITLVYTKQ